MKIIAAYRQATIHILSVSNYKKNSKVKQEISKKEIDDWFEFLKKMILDLKLCTDNIQKIIDETNDNYLKIKDIQPFLGHYVYLCYSHCTLTLSKLFGGKEKRSFIKIFNKLENFKYDKELRELLKENTQKESKELFQNKLEIKKAITKVNIDITNKENLISKIKERRDTFYAHSDPEKKIEPEKLTEIKELSEFSIKLFDNFYSRFYDVSFCFTSNYWQIEPLIQCRIDQYDYYKDLEMKIDENSNNPLEK